jgi:hypothetical protein
MWKLLLWNKEREDGSPARATPVDAYTGQVTGVGRAEDPA